MNNLQSEDAGVPGGSFLSIVARHVMSIPFDQIQQFHLDVRCMGYVAVRLSLQRSWSQVRTDARAQDPT